MLSDSLPSEESVQLQTEEITSTILKTEDFKQTHFSLVEAL